MEDAAVKIWNILDILKISEKLLKEKNIDNPRLNAELLLCDTLNTERIKLYLDFDKPLSEVEITEYRTKIKRRLRNEPLQYIIGTTEFYGLKFNVNPSVLIPRQETELIVDKALEIISSHKLSKPKILEIGTGSGCISVAIAANTDCTIDAIDINERGLETAKRNSELNNTNSRINFLLSNILNDFQNFEGYDIIISNPPYIPAEDFNLLQNEIKDYEPELALTDGKEGLTFYKKIIHAAKNTPSTIKVLLETGDGRKSDLEKLLNLYSIDDYTFYKDVNNIDRVLYFDHQQQ